MRIPVISSTRLIEAALATDLFALFTPALYPERRPCSVVPPLDDCDDPVYNHGPDAKHPQAGESRCLSTSITVLTVTPRRKPCARSERLMTHINAGSARVCTLHELCPCLQLSAGTETAHRHPSPAPAAAVPLVLVETALPAGTNAYFPLRITPLCAGQIGSGQPPCPLIVG